MRYLCNRLTDFDEILHDDTYWSSRAYQLFKKIKLLKTKMVDGRHLKQET